MTLESDLRNMRPPLDRAIAEAEDDTASPATLPPSDPWSRSKVAMLAFVAAVLVAGAVGTIARLESRGRHPAGIATVDTTGTRATNESTSTAPTSTTTTPTTSPTTTTAATVALQSVRWASIAYPMAPHCGTVFTPPVAVQQVAYADPEPGAHVAVVMVRCNAGAGTPVSTVYVYDGATSPDTPHLAATLVSDRDGWQASTLTVDAATISLPVSGFSSSSLPNCCPDVNATLVWNWTGSSYQLVSSVPAHVPGPPSAFS